VTQAETGKGANDSSKAIARARWEKMQGFICRQRGQEPLNRALWAGAHVKVSAICLGEASDSRPRVSLVEESAVLAELHCAGRRSNGAVRQLHFLDMENSL